jgi:predicted dehydrogenase
VINTPAFTRRQFLRRATAAAAAVSFPYVVPSSVLGKAGSVAPSNRIVVGCIGVGSQGGWVMHDFLSQTDAHVAAVCDVRLDTLEAARKWVDKHYQSSGCATCNDFRELLARDDIDAVLIATPDHWHVPIALEAARAGKDIYLEKPMAPSLTEDQALRNAVNRYGTVFQFGTQQRSSSQFRLACELVRNGRIGKLHTINVWAPGSVPGGSTQPVPVPQGLDYNMWLGQAPFTPYTKNKCSYDTTNRTWWFMSDYTLGFISGWGVHPLDIAIWGGGGELTKPLNVEGTGTFPTNGACDSATDWDITFEYDNGLKLHYTAVPIENNGEAVGKNRAWEHRYGRTTSHGTAFEGSEGWVHVDRGGINTHPKKLAHSLIGPDELHLYESKNHVRNFLDCVKTRAKTICPVDEAVRADILCHLSDVAIRLKRRLRWDSQTEHFINDEQADRKMKRSMRSPWHL